MSQPEQPPRFFLDRNLGRKAVPEALRADGWDVITLAEHYGQTGLSGVRPDRALARRQVRRP